jgi:hypothetical protein
MLAGWETFEKSAIRLRHLLDAVDDFAHLTALAGSKTGRRKHLRLL